MVDRIAELEDTEESRQQAMIARAEAVEGRAFFVTREGFMGLGPADARVGDKVCVLWGGHVPFVLREMEGEGPSHHVVIGESYVHGFMHGEAGEDMGEEWEAVRGAEMKAQEFLLR